MLVQGASPWKVASDTPIRIGAAACALLGVIALGVHFGAAPPLPPPDAGATEVADIGMRYHSILLLGAWLQATGTLLCVVFFITLVHLAGGAARLSGLLTVVGAGTLLVVSVIEGAFTIDWAQAAVNRHPAVALSSYDATPGDRPEHTRWWPDSAPAHRRCDAAPATPSMPTAPGAPRWPESSHRGPDQAQSLPAAPTSDTGPSGLGPDEAGPRPPQPANGCLAFDSCQLRSRHR
jgi:hypothetical protein